MSMILYSLKRRILRFLLRKLVSRSRPLGILKEVLLDDDACELKSLVLDEHILDKLLINPKLAASMEFHKHWHILRPLINTEGNPAIVQKYRASRARLNCPPDVKDTLIEVICEENDLFLANGSMTFPDRHSVWTLIHEILLNENYYFESNTASPRILDCGSHCGMAIYYFKSLYPQARITGFEPVPSLRELALENVRKNNYSDVEILPYALSDTKGPATFLVSNADSMAGSLTDRQRAAGDNVSEIAVERRTLSEFLQEPIHFLKLDIEGSEDAVLAEAELSLRNVQHIFCEFHHSAGMPMDRLGKIILLLDKAGFDIRVSHLFYLHKPVQRPMTKLGEQYSAVIWARNRDWQQ